MLALHIIGGKFQIIYSNFAQNQEIFPIAMTHLKLTFLAQNRQEERWDRDEQILVDAD
jgi:hypothetical protein